MIKIVNSQGAERLVTAGAFNSFFKRQGWKIKDKKPMVKVKEIDEEFDEDDFDFEEDKPLEKMTLKELKNYADLSDIDITGLTSKKQIIEAIKAAEEIL
ncbi:MAG: hypothetical protein GX896_06835 [Clostridiales bacterium]|nr:hypothetical protein [Clostridiales bacterium]